MRIQAPRGTFDVLPEDAARREVVEGHAERILGAAGYGRIETPAFEATELFAARRRGGDRHRPEGDVHVLATAPGGR